MKKILIVTTHVDIESRLIKMIKNNILPEAEYSVVAEFFGEVPKVSTYFKNFFPIQDLRNENEISEAIEKSKEWGPFDCVLQTDEYAVHLAAVIREHLNVKGLRTKDVTKFRDKVEMKKSLKDQVRAPYLYEMEMLLNNPDLFPVVVKPRSYAGSKGICVLHSIQELDKYLKEHNISIDDQTDSFREFAMDEVEFEEYIQGLIFHIDGLVFNNEIIFCSASKYEGICLNFLKGEPLGSISIDDKDEQDRWKAFTQQVHEAMEIPDGAFHLEAFLTNEGERIFLEIGIRPGGSLVVPSIEAAVGINLDEAHLQCQLDITPEINLKNAKNYGWLVYPKVYDSESEQKIKEVCLPQVSLPSVTWSEIPGIGQPLTGSFSYVNNLGSFVFVSEATEQINQDLKVLINQYSVI